MVNGNSAIMQFAVESVYGTAPTMTKQIRISSESLKYVPEKKDEGVLTGGKAAGRVNTMSKKFEGSISSIVRPDEAGYWLGLALGVEDQTPDLVGASAGAYKHTFTSIGNDESDSLPSVAFVVDRIVKAYAYTGGKVNTLSFNAQPGDYLKFELALVGKDEVDGTPATLTVSPLKPFKFAQAAVKIGGTTVADVTDIKFTHNNNLDAAMQTTSTGIYFKEPEAGAREIKADLEVLYSTAANGLYTDYFKEDDDVSLEITFTSEEEIETGFPYSLKITIPHMQCREVTPANISGADTLKQGLSLQGVEVGTDELITVELINGLATAYIS